MEDLVNDMEGENSIGLNIVTDDISSANTNTNTNANANNNGRSSKKKPRKNNRYEKRRNKARLAKAKQRQQQQQEEYKNMIGLDSTGISTHNITEGHENHNDGDGETIITNSRTNRDGPSANNSSIIVEDQSNIRTSETTSGNGNEENIDKQEVDEGKAQKVSKEGRNENDHRPKDKPNTDINIDAVSAINGNGLPKSPPSPSPQITIHNNSRKNQHSNTTQYLRDEERRAEYMSTYHARPHEMDRKSGAVRDILPSHASSHIFDTAADADDTNDTAANKNDATSNTKHDNDDDDTGPLFARCGVHPRIVRALTYVPKNEKSTSGFRLTQPTIIQHSAWNQMLPKTKTDGDDGGNGDPRKNLFVQSETGSGKTLAYFVVVLQALAIDAQTHQPKKVDRTIGGTRAIILCPTRELAIQTSHTTEKLCQSSYPWIVSSCLSGGEKRKSEKARLRKGVTVLVATPGRLLDHLDKTECLSLALRGKLEWLVLDESDRLLDMGLGGQVEQIIQLMKANQIGSGVKRDGVTWRSVLVSATITEKVERMAKTLLGGDTWVWARASPAMANNNKGLLAMGTKSNGTNATSDQIENNNNHHHHQQQQLELSSATPKQLSQHHMMVSAKLRLPALIAFLAARVQNKERVVIFMSTCDGVDFHQELFASMNSILSDNGTERDTDNDHDDKKKRGGIFGKSCSIYRLHGNVPHRERNVIISKFSNTNPNNKQAAILIATDVAARGLNLPAVDWIVQYDPPCETADFIHRSGRAARAGKAGHALLFLLPSENQYVEVLKLRGLKDIPALSLATTLQTAAKICPELTSEGTKMSGHGEGATGSRVGEGFACAVQIRLEDCIVEDDNAFKKELAKKLESDGGSGDKQKRRREKKEAKNKVGPLLESARKAFNSYIRGYSTREKAVRHIFSARALHLGHVARSFALKEAPAALSKANRQQGSNDASSSSCDPNEQILKSTGRKRNSRLAFGGGGGGSRKSNDDNQDASERMEDSLNTPVADVHDNRNKSNKKKKMKQGRKPSTFQKGPSASNATISFMDNNPTEDSSFYTIKKSNNGSEQKLSSISNAKAKMLAAANMMQGSGMEFF